MTSDKFFLKQTFTLAKKGMGWTNPNPMVGAIVVKNGQILGKGYHKKFGFPHAEIEAIEATGGRLEGSILYINLEPCVHFGKTPPCVDAIIKAGIKKVICSNLDPNPKVRGMGLAKLEKAGITTSVGLLEEEGHKLNETFFTFHQKKRPFIAIKFASSLDGKIATYTGDSKWITNEKARKFARKLRGQYQAVLVGINTILKDDPHLGIRIKRKKDPLRIILGSRSQMPTHSQVLRDHNILIINPKNIQDLLSQLRELEIISVLVEGGGKTLGKFLDTKLVDKVYAFYAPILIGGEKALSIGGKGTQTIQDALHLKDVSYRRFDDNFLITGYV
ncbi:bifunctional diaminohydroxyphosphoribosylaminopyrimidine deaminase/5-amino-6-(5-phosphoribosylamino)uracil reductase RibD [Candidatus Daviesbacteria bacterium]|nr:bifunctional diaminohydroxyphosphoribosylaminopyrimidine deaminase/5-amino-6-(5-phosphoribosylamino)uracil reductase RibD [Candidatus Daviesbacteria bacterium]